MDLSPEEKQRIYFEEKARLQAVERVRQEARQRQTRRRTFGCLIALGIAVLLVAIPSMIRSPQQGSAPQPTQSPASQSSGSNVVYAKSGCRIRSGPGVKHASLRTAADGERLEFAERKGDWYKLKPDGTGPEQWVHATAVSSTATSPEQPHEAGQVKVQGVTHSAREVEKAISELREVGIITRISFNNNEVQVNRLLWESIPLDAKKGVTLACAAYMKAHGQSSWVDLVDNRTGRKLATHGAWGGVEILGGD